MRGKLISEARETIVQLWSETNASQSVRDAFEGLKTMDEEDFTDELLQKHDDEIEVLQARLDQMRPMLRMIERREEVIAERTKYEEVRNRDREKRELRGGREGRGNKGACLNTPLPQHPQHPPLPSVLHIN